MLSGALPHREAYRNAIAQVEQLYIGKDPIHLKPGQAIPAEAKRKYTVNREPDATLPYERGAKRIKLTKSYLRTEIALNQNSTSYTFGILTNQFPAGANGLLPGEQRLNQQDVFFTYKLGFFVRCMQTGAGNQTFQNELMTFPNSNFFSGFGAGLLDLDLLVGLWTQGQLQVSMNNDVITPAWDLKQHLVIPETQINTMTWPTGAYFNEINMDHDGYAIVEPNWMLNGGNNNQYTIVYPQPINTYGIGAFQFNLVLDYHGFLAQNCSSIMDN